MKATTTGRACAKHPQLTRASGIKGGTRTKRRPWKPSSRFVGQKKLAKRGPCNACALRAKAPPTGHGMIIARHCNATAVRGHVRDGSPAHTSHLAQTRPMRRGRECSRRNTLEGWPPQASDGVARAHHPHIEGLHPPRGLQGQSPGTVGQECPTAAQLSLRDNTKPKTNRRRSPLADVNSSKRAEAGAQGARGCLVRCRCKGSSRAGGAQG